MGAMKFLQTLLTLIVPAAIGTVAGMVVTTPVLFVANRLADDGPYFPPVLVALIVVIPTAFVLLPFQIAAILHQRVSGRWGTRSLLAAGVLGGLVSGLVLNFGLFASSQSGWNALLLGLTLVGLTQGLTTFGCYVLINERRWNMLDPW
jgi:hypothetical protein